MVIMKASSSGPTRPTPTRTTLFRYSKQVQTRLGEIIKVEKSRRIVTGRRPIVNRGRQEGQLMTIETPKANRPLHQTTMFANSPSVFYDYATSPVTSDHSLQTDLRFSSSPNSLTMYDGEPELLPSSLGSVCSTASFVDTGQQPEDFDLKPQFECTDNAFLHQCLQMAADGGISDDTIGGMRSDPAWSPTEAGLMKMEDIFQVDQKDAIQGPTLAELNFDDSLSVYDDVVEKDVDQQKRMVSGGCTLWQQAILSGMDNTANVPQVVCGGQKPPIRFTTCTVTSPTATAVDMRMSTMENKSVTSSHSTLPQSLYAVTAKLSLFSESPKIIANNEGLSLTSTSNSGCLKVPPQQQQNTLGLLSSLVPQPPPLQPSTAVAKLATSTTNNPNLQMAMETEDTKSSLQRLLTDPLPPVIIKSEPVDIPMACPASAPMWHSAPAAAAIGNVARSPLSPPTSAVSSSMGLLAVGSPLKSIKRARSPEVDSSNSITSMEQKWEEIKQFIHDEDEESLDEELAHAQIADNQPPQIRHHRQQPVKEEQMALTPPKRIKVEPKDPAFTVKDEVDSAEEDTDVVDIVDSDAEDSDDGGESLVGRDHDDNSDAESDSQFSLLDENTGSSKGPPRYFWMYNTQSKGPKGKRLCKAVSTVDPYTLGDFEDPVFDPELNQTQYKHNGKARRGDGNDITPSPQKLYALGNELKKLNSTINDLTPVSELPSGARSKSRKEKNKLASRACRLKKKAQHEANKVKLYGLEREHHDLLTVLSEIRDKVFKLVQSGKLSNSDAELLSPKLERLMKLHLTHMIAGHTADYVNSVLAKVVAGDPKGGLAL